MNKTDVLIAVGTLEVQFEKEERLLNELTLLKKCIVKDDYLQAAIYFGRLKEFIKFFNINIDDSINEIYKYISEVEKKLAQDKIQNMPIADFNFSVRTFNCLVKNRVYTGSGLVKMSITELRKLRNMSSASIEEIVTTLKEYGLELKE